MTQTLTIGTTGRGGSLKPFELPTNFVTETIAILAKRGAGKTYLMRKIAEQMIKAGLPVVIIDPIGVCWGLRSSANGKGDGLPVIIFGGDHKDLPLEAESGEVLADWGVAERRPVVFDLSALESKAAERRFVTAFAKRIYRKNREPLHIMLDEADYFAPQQPGRGDEPMLGAIQTLARRGRARGIGLTMATQRSAVLNKNVLTQAEVLVAMRMTAPHDRKAIEEWIKYHGDKEDREKVLGTLGELPVGTAWFWSPGRLDGLSKVQVGRCETFDSSATPKAGEDRKTVYLEPVDLGALSEKIRETVERAKEDDPAALRKQVAELKRELASEKPKEVEVRVEVPVVHKLALEQVTDARLAVEKLAADFSKVVAHVKRAEDIVRMAPTKSAPVIKSLLKKLRSEPAAPSITFGDGTSHETTPPKPSSNGATKLKGGERKILTALAQFGLMNKRRLAALTGYKMTGGGFQSLLSGLRTANLIVRGDQMELTEGGQIAIADSYQPLPTGAALLEMWLAKLPKAPRLCLHRLYEAYPESLTKSELATRTNYEAAGGGFQSAISKLNTLGLIDRTGSGIRASENLFT